MASPFVFVEGQATDTEQEFSFSVCHVVYITNDGATAIIVNLDGRTGEPGAFRIEPGETVANIPLAGRAGIVVLKTVFGAADFRALGRV